MKIVYICNEYPPAPHGGIGVTVRIWAHNMVERGHRVFVLGIYNAQGFKKIHSETDQGVSVVRVPVPQYRFGWLIARYQLFNFLQGLVRKNEVDVIEAPDYEWMFAGWTHLKIPLVTRFHGSGTYNSLEQGMAVDRKYFLLEKMSIKRSRYFAASSVYTARRSEEIYGLPSGCVRPIYPPIETYSNNAPNLRSKTKVVFSGALVRRKGVVSLIQAWHVVLQKHPLAELHIYGKDGRAPDGTSMKAYLQNSLPQEARDSVYFHGHIDRQALWQELATARVAVFPSYSETFGNAPVEAMSAGCPTIYTKRSCGPEIIEHDVDGLLVEPDDISDISASIIRILDDDALASRLGKAAQEKVKAKFSVESAISQNEMFYAQCIADFAYSS